jgi:hypothetical protein
MIVGMLADTGDRPPAGAGTTITKLGEIMTRTLSIALAGLLFAPLALAGSDSELTAPIHQFIDGFNGGDTKSAYAAYAGGSISIIDEFAPHLWVGPKAAHAWADAYDKHAKATGVSDGNVKYGEPTRTEVEGNLAYVVIPTVYNYKEHGKATTEEGQMTFVLDHGTGGWKIRAWCWSGVKPHAPK